VPALPIRKKRVGCNLIVQHLFMGATCKAQIFDSDDLIRVAAGAHRRDFARPVLRRKVALIRGNLGYVSPRARIPVDPYPVDNASLGAIPCGMFV
jgi:hypothetical protein